MGNFAALNSFNAGELSEKMIGRFDVSQYSKGCLTLRNFLVTPYGAAERRPGTIYVAPLRSNDSAVRLIPFVFSLEISYICEFGDHFIRFYRNDQFVSEIESPYSSDDLARIQFVQSADVMTLVHRGRCGGRAPRRMRKLFRNPRSAARPHRRVLLRRRGALGFLKALRRIQCRLRQSVRFRRRTCPKFQ